MYIFLEINIGMSSSLFMIITYYSVMTDTFQSHRIISYHSLLIITTSCSILMDVSYPIISHHLLTIYCNSSPFCFRFVELLHNMFSFFYHGLFPGTLHPSERYSSTHTNNTLNVFKLHPCFYNFLTYTRVIAP